MSFSSEKKNNYIYTITTKLPFLLIASSICIAVIHCPPPKILEPAYPPMEHEDDVLNTQTGFNEEADLFQPWDSIPKQDFSHNHLTIFSNFYSTVSQSFTQPLNKQFLQDNRENLYPDDEGSQMNQNPNSNKAGNNGDQ